MSDLQSDGLRTLALDEASPVLSVIAPPSLAGTRIGVAADDRILLGREGVAQMNALGLSRRHAWVRYDGTDLVITDAGSTNGTYVNGDRVEKPTVLRDGDRLGLGALELVVAIAGQQTRPRIPTPRRPPVDAEQPDDASETTRYLCAAVQRDRKFREYVIEEIVDQPYRAICPSYGVDLVTVARHAVSAQRRVLVRDAVLALLMIVLVVLVWGAVTAALSGGTEPPAPLPVGAVVLVLVAAWLVVVAFHLYEGYAVLARRLARTEGDVAQPRLTPSPSLARRLDTIESAQSGNVTVFKDYLPFVGSGLVFDHWSFAIDIERGSLEDTGAHGDPDPFDAEDLYSALQANLAGTGIRGLRIEQRLFVHGRDVRNYQALLPEKVGRPVPRADPELLRQALRTNQGSARTYLSIQVTGWRGHLVATLFFRAVRLHNALYLESTSTALLPLSKEFAELLHRPRDRVSLLLKALGEGSSRTLASLVLSPVRVVRGVVRPLHAWQLRRSQRRQIKEGTFDYGSTTSVREKAAGGTFHRYYLEFDRDMYDKVLQERLLKHVLHFLEEHHVDTSAFAQQMVNINTQNTYNNQNIESMSGGNVVGGSAKVKGGVKSSPPAAPRSGG